MRTVNTPLVAVLTASIALSASGAPTASTLFVDDDAPPAGDGLSWETAFRLLQDALANAAGWDEIRVAQGVYAPDRDEANPAGTGDREATFRLTNGVSIKGGFAGLGAPDPNDRDIEIQETILTGDLRGDDDPGDFPFGPTFSDNSYHVVAASPSADPTASLDGFTITGGSAEGAAALTSGAGLLNEGGNPSIVGCTFRRNAAWSQGGGIRSLMPGSPTLLHCTFEQNIATGGGGAMYITSGNPVLSGCSFVDNQAGSEQQSAEGGGLVAMGGATMTAIGCSFSGNTATNLGGAMTVLGSSSATCIDCTFHDNRATGPSVGGLAGGAVVGFGASSLVFSDCTFTDNMASNGIDNGLGGGLGLSAVSTCQLVQCTFRGNSAFLLGGAVYSHGVGLLEVIGCSFSSNTAASGGGIYNDEVGGSGVLTADNSILWDNVPDQIVNDGTASATVSFSDVQGGWFGDGGNNIDADPLFVDAEGGDLRLGSGSPCIDAGDNGAIPPTVVTDLAGNPRLQEDRDVDNTGAGECPFVDMGPYELQTGVTDCCPWDLSTNPPSYGVVDILDFLALIALWGTDPGGPPDFDGDGDVGVTDFLELLANWGPCPV
ncbi:MAG: right-handed parallel beta-helix repeat-containing protein [Planctomycetota bacterium]|jgi:predicted outer membrane repeat protein